MAEVLIYTRPACSHCARAKSLLATRGVDFHEVDLVEHPEEEQAMVRRSGERLTVPQVFIDGRPIGGADELDALASSGELDRLLGAPAVLRDPAPEAGEVVHDVLIIGSGPAGLTAAIYCARANLKPVVLEGLGAGGQLMATTDVENYPGFPEGVQGPAMMELFRAQAARFGTLFVPGDATRVDFGSRPFRVWTGQTEIVARAVIIATGASPRKLDIPGEERYAGRGVSYCATCDGFFFRDHEIAVVGGGDTAMEEALFLARYGKRVTIVHRRDRLRASKIMADRALGHAKISILWDTAVDEVLGDGTKVTGMRLRHLKTGDVRDQPCSGFFVGIGHEPNTALFAGLLPMDAQGYLVIHDGSRTAIEGVFAAGDVHDHTYRQAVTAAGAGCRAAIDCERWLERAGR